jgi:glycosyltransferase involved in cell wall biosynthesis
MSKLAPGSTTRIVAVIPAFNESETIADVVRRTRAHVDEVIVVDDGSSDDTCGQAANAGARVEQLHTNVGKGAALIRGLELALDHAPDAIVTLDGDGEHAPEDLPAMLEASQRADIVLGYRDVYRSTFRRFLNGLALFWFRLLHPQTRDTICGFRVFRSHTLAKVHNDAGGFSYEHEVILLAILNRLSMAWVPIKTSPRQHSNVNLYAVVRANNHFDLWVLGHLGSLPIALWRKGLLVIGCLLGLLLGKPLEWIIRLFRS